MSNHKVKAIIKLLMYILEMPFAVEKRGKLATVMIDVVQSNTMFKQTIITFDRIQLQTKLGVLQTVSQPAVIGCPIGRHTIGPA